MALAKLAKEIDTVIELLERDLGSANGQSELIQNAIARLRVLADSIRADSSPPSHPHNISDGT